MHDVVIRPPRLLLLVSAPMMIFMLSIGIRVTIETRGHPFIVLWTIGVVIIGGANFSQTARTRGDVLRVRNLLRVHEFTRADIDRFVLFTPSMRGASRLPQRRTRSAGNVVSVLLHNGRVAPLHATRRLFNSGEVERFQQALEAWRTSPLART